MIHNLFLVVFGNLFSAFFNYLFHLLSGRILSIASYGEMESLLTFTTVASVITGAISPVIVKHLSAAPQRDLSGLFNYFNRQLIKSVIFVFIILIIIFPLVSYILKISDITAYLLIVFQIIMGIFVSVYLSVFQSRFKFLYFLLLGLCTSVFRNIFILLFSWMNLQYLAPYLSTTLANILVAIFSFLLIIRIFKIDLKVKNIYKINFWSFSILAFIASLANMLVVSQDIFIARYVFSPENSGIFSAVTVIGKIILFSALPVSSVAYPYFTKNLSNNRRFRVLCLSIAISLIISLPLNTLYWFFPKFITGLLYPSSYIAAHQYIAFYGLFISLYLVENLFIQFHLSRQSLLSVFIPLISIITQPLFFTFTDRSISSLVLSLVVSQIIGIVFALIFTLKLEHFNVLKQIKHSLPLK